MADLAPPPRTKARCSDHPSAPTASISRAKRSSRLASSGTVEARPSVVPCTTTGSCAASVRKARRPGRVAQKRSSAITSTTSMRSRLTRDPSREFGPPANWKSEPVASLSRYHNRHSRLHHRNHLLRRSRCRTQNCASPDRPNDRPGASRYRSRPAVPRGRKPPRAASPRWSSHLDGSSPHAGGACRTGDGDQPASGCRAGCAATAPGAGRANGER